MSDDTEDGVYSLTPYGLLRGHLGADAARQAIDVLELYLRRHHGVPSGIVLTDDGFIFSRLEAGTQEHA